MVVNRIARAKQFLPFDALKGLQEALREKEIAYEEKKELSEETLAELNKSIYLELRAKKVIKNINPLQEEILGDVVICIEKVKEQAEEYNHSFERELAYMVVHGFYHLMGYDHIEETDKKIMREKEEKILEKLDIKRG